MFYFTITILLTFKFLNYQYNYNFIKFQVLFVKVYYQIIRFNNK